MTTTLAATVSEAVPATGVFGLVWVLIALPLAGAAILLVGGRRTDRWGHWLGAATPLVAFGFAVAMFVGMLGKSADERSYNLHVYDWVVVGHFQVPFGLQLDQLSMVFVLLITGVGGLIHVYSIGYMGHDPDRRRFFGYLNLFVAAMLLLVLADNFLLLYFGWEGVGLASYLLIGFWFSHTPNAVAGNKAFFVNRVGDMGMSLAIMLMFVTFGSVTFSGVLPQAGQASGATLNWIGILLLVAACGKSAQFPLQSWLLDAMAGPTPVSALIHAATMVTAGVYLITRSNPIFDASPDALTVVLIVGAITLLMGAIIACAKDDIKKSLAGSTMSQIGYMVLAAGLGPVGYVFAIFHLLLHGFFKATLFLSAGSVMHAMKDEVDMRRYGALRGAMTLTFVGFTAAYLAILGIPPFSGFFSKDKIIEAAFGHGWVPGLVALLGAGITAFYMTRMFAMTFTGQARWEDDRHPHESPPSMTVPILILAALSTVGGLVLAQNDRIEDWLEPVLGYQETHLSIPAWTMSLITLVVVLLGVALAWMQYGRRLVPVLAPRGNVLTRAARADLYGDAVNEALLMRPGQWLTRFLVFFDNRGIDGVVGGTAATIGGLSGRSRRWQSGYVRAYALTMLAGATLLGAVFLLARA